MTNRYHTLFSCLQQNNEKAFVPFVTLCDPNPRISIEIIRKLIQNGADALELGLPFSDPVADGPVIQAASIRALSSGGNIKISFEIIKTIRKEFPDIPIGLLVYSNLVITKSMDTFYSQAANSGVDSVLIADVPIIESFYFSKMAKNYGIQPIYIAPPNSSDRTLQSIALESKGYVYLVSRTGVTGSNDAVKMPLKHIIESLKRYKASPTLLGFGISTVEQVKQAIQFDVGGVISGSAVVSIIEQYQDDEEVLFHHLGPFIQKMKQATRF
jgi:tryptophan synthase alpha chain